MTSEEIQNALTKALDTSTFHVHITPKITAKLFVLVVGANMFAIGASELIRRVIEKIHSSRKGGLMALPKEDFN